MNEKPRCCCWLLLVVGCCGLVVRFGVGGCGVGDLDDDLVTTGLKGAFEDSSSFSSCSCVVLFLCELFLRDFLEDFPLGRIFKTRPILL